MLNCDLAVFQGDKKVNCKHSFESIESDRRSGLAQRRAVLEIPSDQIDLLETGSCDLLLRSSSGFGEGEHVLAVKLRDSVRLVPSSLFFRSGESARKSLVVRTEEAVEIEAGETAPFGITSEVKLVDERLVKIEVTYDGSIPVTGSTTINVSITKPNRRLVRVPVYFMDVSTPKVGFQE